MRLRIGNSAKSLVLVGVHGVGKTVLLERMPSKAEGRGSQTLRIEAPENKSLPAMLAPELRNGLLHMSTIASAKQVSLRAQRALAGFARGPQLKFAAVKAGFDGEPAPGLADNGELASDLTALLVQTGEAAKAAGTVMVMSVDELQCVNERAFAALITALHHRAHLRLHITLVGAGLPHMLAFADGAKP